MTAAIDPYTPQLLTQIFDIKINPIKIGSQRIIMLSVVLFFPFLIASSIIYTYLNWPRYTFITVIVGVVATLLLIFFKVSKKYTQKAIYHLVFHQNAVTLFKSYKVVRHIPL